MCKAYDPASKPPLSLWLHCYYVNTLLVLSPTVWPLPCLFLALLGEDVPPAVEAVLRWCWTITGGRRLAHVVGAVPHGLLGERCKWRYIVSALSLFLLLYVLRPDVRLLAVRQSLVRAGEGEFGFESS